MVGGEEIFTLGFGFIGFNTRCITTITLPSGFIGNLEYITTSGPDATGQTFRGAVLHTGAGPPVSNAASGPLSHQKAHPVWDAFSFAHKEALFEEG